MIDIILLVALAAMIGFATHTLIKADFIIRTQRMKIDLLEKLLMQCYHEATPFVQNKIKELLQ